MESNGSDELTSLKLRYPKQPLGVLKAYLKAKRKLEQRGLPVVSATGKKSNLTVAGYAFNQGLLEHLSTKEGKVYKILLQGLPFQYRAREVIAEEAGVSISTARQAISKLEKIGLLARHRVPNSSCVLAFTDTTQLKPDQIMSLKIECEQQLIEKAKEEPVIKRELRTGEPFLVHKQRILKERKEDHPAPPGFSSFYGGEFAQVSHKNQSEAGQEQDQARIGLTCDEDITPGDLLRFAMTASTGSQVEHELKSTCTGNNSGLPGKDEPAHNTCTCTGDNDPDHTALTGIGEPMGSNTCTGSPVNEHGLTLTCTGGNPGLTGIDKLVSSLKAETGRSYQTPEMPVVNSSPFRCIPKIMYDQSMLCHKPEVFDLQDSIDSMVKKKDKSMDICTRINPPGFIRELRERVGRGSVYDDDRNTTFKLIQPYLKNGVMKHVLSELAVLRGDTEAQIQTWIAYAKLKGKNPNNIGGLLISIILKAQRVDTDELYPEAAGTFELFLDDLKIGITPGDGYELTPEEQDQLQRHQNAPGDEIDLAAEKAGLNSRRALLRDYTGVLQVLMQRELESDPRYSSDDLVELLKTLYDEGDANYSPVAVDAPGSVKVSMVKLALHRAVDADLFREQRPVYLPHWIHEEKKQRRKAEEAAAA